MNCFTTTSVLLLLVPSCSAAGLRALVSEDTSVSPSNTSALLNIPARISTPDIPDLVSCNSSFDCGNGLCIEEIFCKCDRGWITVDSACDYQQKSQLTAFLLAFFTTTIGAARFYVCNYVHAGFQLGLLISACACPCLACCFDDTRGTSSECSKFYAGIVSSVLSIWTIADMIIAGMNNMKDECDGHSFELKPW